MQRIRKLTTTDASTGTTTGTLARDLIGGLGLVAGAASTAVAEG